MDSLNPQIMWARLATCAVELHTTQIQTGDDKVTGILRLGVADEVNFAPLWGFWPPATLNFPFLCRRARWTAVPTSQRGRHSRSAMQLHRNGPAGDDGALRIVAAQAETAVVAPMVCREKPSPIRADYPLAQMQQP